MPIPGENDVVCGGSRMYHYHSGNLRFRKLVDRNVVPYANAAKSEKSSIISAIINSIRTKNPRGDFVQKDSSSGLYIPAGDHIAREKTSQAFRDALHIHYKSSCTSKKQRRMVERSTRQLNQLKSIFGSSLQSSSFLLDSQEVLTASTGEASDVKIRPQLPDQALTNHNMFVQDDLFYQGHAAAGVAKLNNFSDTLSDRNEKLGLLSLDQICTFPPEVAHADKVSKMDHASIPEIISRQSIAETIPSASYLCSFFSSDISEAGDEEANSELDNK